MESRIKINLRDQNFPGDDSSCHGSNSEYIEWIRTNEPVSDTVILTDLCLQDIHKASKSIKRKVAWILEPRAIHPHVYEWIERNNRLFDFVFTFDTDLINRGENYLYYPHGRCWIPKDWTRTKAPTKRISIIASGKDYAPGHKLRHEVINRLATKHNIDVYGYGYKPVKNKTEALEDYAFSITIENSIQPGYWTEKIVDCFAVGTIPLVWGDKSINKFFNPEGIVFFDNIEHLDWILSGNLIDEFLKSFTDPASVFSSKISKMVSACAQNKDTVETYRVPEDWMFKNYNWLFT